MKMSMEQKSKRAFLAVTAITVISVASVFMVYAVLLASYTGGNVTITGIGGNIEYSATNSEGASWTDTLTQGSRAQWYARIAITGSPAQQVTVTWTLRNVTASSDVTTDFVTTTITLATGTSYIYASSDGLIASNHNWGDHSIASATYQVNAAINTV